MASISQIALAICKSGALILSRLGWTAVKLSALVGLGLSPVSAANLANCAKPVYLSFDTGSQEYAHYVAQTLRQQKITATFFIANERNKQGGFALDNDWAAFWRGLLADGHTLANHTYDHVYILGDTSDGKIRVKPQFGAQAGQILRWSPAEFCQELRRLDQRLLELTGQNPAPFWRAPGGKLSKNALAAASACGYQHVGWSASGWSGDELPSERYSNASLLNAMLAQLRSQDIILIHLGIWSRRDAWVPANLLPLIDGLRQRGFCFASLRQRPSELAIK